MEVKRINIGLLTANTGQIEGLPANPRTWTQTEIDRLAKSLQETPELFEMRPLLVYEQGLEYIILGGNLRYEGAKKNKATECPCIVIPADTDVEKLKEIVIKDNGSFGEWDITLLADEWGDLPLEDWGVVGWGDEEKETKPSKDISNDIESSFRIEISCASEGEQEMLYAELIGRGLECRILTL